MAKNKFSPACKNQPRSAYIYNAFGEVPVFRASGEIFNEKIHYGIYDVDGYDRYGYSAWNKDGTYAGDGRGIDRNGYTEDQYLCMADDEFNSF